MTTHSTPLLRSPVEFAAFIAFAAVAILFVVAPPALNVPPRLGLALGGIFALIAAFRFSQGMRLIRYRRLLCRRRPYFIEKVVTSDTKLFLGKGFRWEQPHVQRLKEARSATGRKFLHRISSSGGDPILHGVGMNEREIEVYTSLAERTGHMLVLGATRVGKTRLAELLISQDILRGDAVIVLDPKGDTDLLRRIYHEVGRAGRRADLRIFHLRHPEESQTYNPIANYHAPTEIASRISEQLPSKGESAAFKSFAWRFINTIAVALDAMNRTPDFRLIYEYIEDIEPLVRAYHKHMHTALKTPNWTRVIKMNARLINPKEKAKSLQSADRVTIAMIEFRKKNRIKDEIAKDLEFVLQYDPVYYSKITASLLPLLQKLKSGSTSALLSPDEHTTPINWNEVVERNQIVYVGLDTLSNPVVARSVGNAVFADIASTIGGRYAQTEGAETKNRISIHADEFNDVVGPHLHPMLSKSGGAGVQITAYTQTLADIEASLDGDRASASRLVGNFNSIVMLRVRTLDTARVLVDQVPSFDVTELVESASVSDSSQPDSDVSFTSSISDRISTRSVPGLEPSDLMRLPKGEAYALIDGGDIWKLRIPLIRDEPEKLTVREMMRRAK